MAFSTVTAQLAQVIPVTGRIIFFVFAVGLLIVAEHIQATCL
jgi:hypothetical protein